MPNLKRLSGQELIRKLESVGFSITRQKGSHIRLSRFSLDKTVHVTIPNHNELDKGTQKAIVRSVISILTEKEINDIFYTE